MKRHSRLALISPVCGISSRAIAVIVILVVSSPVEAASKKIDLVTGEISLGKVHPGAVFKSLVVSPGRKRIAYVAWRGGKWLVVVDAVEGKQYNGITESSLTLNPDGKRVAYGAGLAGKQFVVDGAEGKEYRGFLGRKLVFDNPNLLHILVVRDKEFFRVEVKIAEGE